MRRPLISLLVAAVLVVAAGCGSSDDQSGGAAIVPGVVSGQFQFGFSNVTSLLIDQSRGLPLKVVSNGVASTGKDKADFGGLVTREASIRTAADLAGKRVAVNTLKNIGDTAPDLTVAVYFTSEQLIKNDPDLVKRFTEAMTESLAYADAHPDEARQVLTSYTQIDEAVIKELTLPKWPAEINRASVETLATLAVQDGLVTKQPDLNALLP